MHFAIRVALWLITHTIFKVKIVGRRNIPDRGPALLVSNHISYADGFLIAHCVGPAIRFLVWTPFFSDAPFSLDSSTHQGDSRGIRRPPRDGGRRETMESILRSRQELAAEQLVCIFPEGSITRDGELHPFKRGMEKIAEGLHVPIVPVRIDGLWGSIFSIEGERWPRRLPYRVTICFGDICRLRPRRAKSATPSSFWPAAMTPAIEGRAQERLSRASIALCFGSTAYCRRRAANGRVVSAGRRQVDRKISSQDSPRARLACLPTCGAPDTPSNQTEGWASATDLA